ncbi:MAG: four helix bundle protein [Patescibacteria group bacterium]
MEFEDLLMWQKAEELVIKVYTNFKDCKDWSFKDQIQRAAISVMNNIAEGYERRNDKEFRHFLRIAKSSAGEVRSMLRVAIKISYIEAKVGMEMIADARQVSQLIAGFIRRLSI